MPTETAFNPRGAALRYAGQTEGITLRDDPALTETVNAVVCALIYVGDRLDAVVDRLANIDQAIQTID